MMCASEESASTARARSCACARPASNSTLIRLTVRVRLIKTSFCFQVVFVTVVIDPTSAQKFHLSD